MSASPTPRHAAAGPLTLTGEARRQVEGRGEKRSPSSRQAGGWATPEPSPCMVRGEAGATIFGCGHVNATRRRATIGSMANRRWWVAGFGVAVATACGGDVGSQGSPSGGRQGGAGSSSSPETGGAPSVPAGSGGVPSDAGVDASWLADASLFWEGGVPWDALPLPDSGPVAECVGCARDQCAEPIDACVTDPACSRGLACAAVACESNDTACYTACFEDDTTAIVAGTLAMACLLGQCGESCLSDLSWASP